MERRSTGLAAHWTQRRGSQSVSVTHLLAWRTGPHAHTRCTRLAREPTRGTLSPAVALGPDRWTHSSQLTGQLTRWRYVAPARQGGDERGRAGTLTVERHRDRQTDTEAHSVAPRRAVETASVAAHVSTRLAEPRVHPAYLPISPHISPYLPISRVASTLQVVSFDHSLHSSHR